MFKKNKIILIFLLAVFAVLPCFTNAQSLSLISEKSSYKVGDEILISLKVDTSEKLINTISGNINFSEDFFDVQSINNGDSFLTIWVKRPVISNTGEISFAGGVPHGFSGQSGNVFSFVLKSKKIGEVTISIKNTTILLNDGLGTELKNVSLLPLKIIISEKNGDELSQTPPDISKIGPLPFTPVIGKNAFVAENKLFVSFSTTDKSAGVSYYQIREEYVLFPFFAPLYSTQWQKSETPYILKLQHWWSKIYVRAYNGNGIFTEAVITKPLDKVGIIVLFTLISFLVIVLLLITIFIYLKFRKK